MRLRRKVAQSSALVLIGAFVQRLMPIILGALLVRLGGHEALAVQNGAYVTFAVSAAFTSSGLIPFIVRHGATEEEGQSPWTFSVAIFHLLFTGYVIFAWASDILSNSGLFLLPLLGAYTYNVFQIHLSHLHSMKAYREALVVNLVYAGGTIALVCAGLYFGLRSDNAVYGGYIAASCISLVAAMNYLGPAAKLATKRLFWVRAWLWQMFFYSALSALTVGATYLAFSYLHRSIEARSFNQLIFTYQLFSFVIFIPGLMTPVVVPYLRDLTKAGGKMPKPIWMMLAYGTFGAAGAILVAGLLHTAARVYGLGELRGMFDLYCILFAAIPGSMTASLNQLNIFEDRPHVPFAGAIVSALVLFMCLAYVFPLEQFGRVLLLSASANFIVSLVFRLQSLTLPDGKAS